MLNKKIALLLSALSYKEAQLCRRKERHNLLRMYREQHAQHPGCRAHCHCYEEVLDIPYDEDRDCCRIENLAATKCRTRMKPRMNSERRRVVALFRLINLAAESV